MSLMGCRHTCLVPAIAPSCIRALRGMLYSVRLVQEPNGLAVRNMGLSSDINGRCDV